MEQLLIVEDDRELNQGLCRALQEQDRKIIPCANLRAAREQLSLGTPSLVLLDVNLPDGSGLELLRQIRDRGQDVAVILLTARDTDLDIVEGLEQGADDYITKPFSLSVLRARVNTQLRRRAVSQAMLPIQIDGYEFDFARLQFRLNGEAVELSKTEQKLLYLLVENRGTVVSRERLIDRVWSDGADFVDENALSVAVKRLRDKLGAQDYIRTVYGIGYSWVKKNG